MSIDDPAVAAAFLERFLRDREAGEAVDLETYKEIFAGHEALIEREYAALTDPGPEETADEDRSPAVAHYRLLEEIGRGGQGSVHRARDTRLKRVVAIKVLDHLGQRSEAILQRFRREAEVASRLDHPGICTILDSGTARGVTYIAMRFVPGRSLAQELSEARAEGSAPTTREEVLRIVRLFEKAALATHAAHEAGIVHRDIKPGNVMVTPEDDPVLLDFGLARDESGDRATLTRTGDVFGTPAYMSPEQLRGEGARLDRRTDVYSLGASLFERLTLRAPFESPTREGLYRAILEQDAPSPQSLNRALPQDLAVVVLTALEKDRGRRYQTARDLAEDLGRVRRLEPIRARPVTAWMRAGRWIQRNRTVAGLAALLIVVLSTSLGVIWNQNLELASELEDARAGRSSKKRQQVDALIERGFQTLFGADPTGADVAFEEALDLEPDNQTALAGRLWFSIYDPEQALQFLDGLPESVRDAAQVAWMRGLVLEVNGRPEEAAVLYEQAGGTNTDLREYLTGLRLVRGFEDRSQAAAEKAMAHFRQAILMARSPRFHYFHSLLMAASYAEDEATMIAAAAMLEHHWPDQPATLETIARFFMEADQPRAVAALHRLMELRPTASACMGLATVALSRGDQDEALEWFTRGTEVQPEFAPVWYMRGVTHARRGDTELARADYLEAVTRDPRFYLAALDLARSHHEAGDTSGAVRFLEQYVEQVADVPIARKSAEHALAEYRAAGSAEDG